MRKRLAGLGLGVLFVSGLLFGQAANQRAFSIINAATCKKSNNRAGGH